MAPWCFCVGFARFACSAEKTKINPKYEQTQNTNPKYEQSNTKYERTQNTKGFRSPCLQGVVFSQIIYCVI